MNRKQRRNFGKKVGQIDTAKLKDTLFGAILKIVKFKYK